MVLHMPRLAFLEMRLIKSYGRGVGPLRVMSAKTTQKMVDTRHVLRPAV